jgi:outer membrane receptor protein involved in Fe transport
MKQILLLIFIPVFCYGQDIKGKVVDNASNQGVPGAKLQTSEGKKATANPDGSFSIPFNQLPVKLIVSAETFVNDTINVTSLEFITLKLSPEVVEISTLVVTASRRGQRVEEVPISMEVLKPTLIDNKGITDLEQAVDQSPGVYAMDGQVSIRGGSGYSYGAGSRVLLLWNDVPILSGDAGDAKWNAVPMEISSRIEVIKGASSVLYGSGALNGIIAVTERDPPKKAELKVKVQSGIYDDAKRASLNWRSKNPTFQLAEVSYGKMYNKFGYNISMTGFNNKGYRDGETESRGRVSGSFLYKPEKVKRLKMGIGYSFHYQKVGSFIVWESDSLAYTPQGGSDINVPGSSLSITKGTRINIDPYLKYITIRGNKHNLRTRMYRVMNESFTNPGQNSVATNYYADYNYQKAWKKTWFLTAGATAFNSIVNSALYGDHKSNNYSGYVQLEKKYKKLDFTAGFRFEYFDQDGKKGDSDYYLINKGGDTTGKIPVFPILRTAVHYELFKYTHLRASFGQGVRYPAIAERYTQTSVGSLNVFPNPALQRETGWAAEIGIKQGVKIGENWKGLLDIAGFINQYDNMMEFTFGIYNPADIQISLNPNDPGYLNKWIGFRASNAEKARISGIEGSFSSEGKIGNVELRSLIGYTYMNPVSMNNDKYYRATFSDTVGNLLKYRFKHLAKADIEAVYKGFSLGFSARYNSFMKNIDRVFEDEVIPGTGIYILPGLKKYRQEHNGGNLVFDARIGYEINENYRVGFVVNNILNTEYMGRPGDIQAPRNFILQIQAKI